MSTTTPGILNVLLRRRPVAAAVEGAIEDSNETPSMKETTMTTTAPIATAPVTPAPTATAPAAPAPDVLAKIGAEAATLEQLEAAFSGETEFVLASLREKRTLAQAQGAYIAVLKDRNTKLAAQVGEKDAALKGLGTEGLGVAPLPASATGDAAGQDASAGGFKTYDAAVAHYQKAGDKQAHRTAAIKHPALHLAWRAEQGQKATKAVEDRELKKRGGAQS